MSAGRKPEIELADLSQLLDGEMDEGDADELLRRVQGDPALRDAWLTYHVVGDALRRQSAPGHDNQAFLSRIAEALVQEPSLGVQRPSVAAQPRRTSAQKSEPDRWLRRWVSVGVPALGMAAAVASVTWVVATRTDFARPVGPVSAPAIASAPVAEHEPAPLSASADSVPVVATEYLLAHQQFAPSARYSAMVSYVRTVAATGTGMAPAAQVNSPVLRP